MTARCSALQLEVANFNFSSLFGLGKYFMLTRVIKSVRRRLALRMKRTYKIGRYFIRLPPRHLLDVYQESFKNYDKKLPVLAALLEGKYKSSMTIIDIGANIGDSAIALRNACNSPIICAEGNPEFLPILKSNLAAIPGIFRVIEKFIGPGANVYVFIKLLVQLWWLTGLPI